jgi:hypothetical protein
MEQHTVGIRELEQVIIVKDTPNMEDIKKFGNLIESNILVYNNPYQLKELFVKFCKWVEKIK